MTSVTRKKTFPIRSSAIFLIFLNLCHSVNSFVITPPTDLTSIFPTSHQFHHHYHQHPTSTYPLSFPLRHRQNSKPHHATLSTLTTTLTNTLKPTTTRLLAALLSITTLLLTQSRRLRTNILWPGSSPDPQLSETYPLPPGSFGCPLLGNFILAGDHRDGPGSFFRKLSRRLRHPNIFKYYAFGRPMVGVRGSSAVRNVLEREFRKKEGVNALGSLNADLFGSQSLLSSQSKREHSFLRRLVGQAMTSAGITAAIPELVRGSEVQVEKLVGMEGERVRMEDICTDFTLDVAWRQILGLQLEDEAIPIFHQKVNEWIYGLLNPLPLLFPRVTKFTKAYKARVYLVKLIEDKIDELERLGQSDGSTLGNMVFAADEEETDDDVSPSARRLTRKQIVDNAMVLILAGSETSASTLTNAFLLMGKHPDVWKAIIEEQRSVMSRSGSTITKSMIDDDFPYLEAVIKETMRIRPLSGGIARVAKESFVLDGMQIPKGWAVSYNIRLTHERDPVTMVDDKNTHMDVMKGFKPERWLDETTRPGADWIPLGYGPRYCLGANLAMAEMKIFLAMMARHVDFELVDGEEEVKWRKISIIPKPVDGVVVRPQKRDLLVEA